MTEMVKDQDDMPELTTAKTATLQKMADDVKLASDEALMSRIFL
jgi:hypothetical protein